MATKLAEFGFSGSQRCRGASAHSDRIHGATSEFELVRSGLPPWALECHVCQGLAIRERKVLIFGPVPSVELSLEVWWVAQSRHDAAHLPFKIPLRHDDPKPTRLKSSIRRIKGAICWRGVRRPELQHGRSVGY